MAFRTRRGHRFSSPRVRLHGRAADHGAPEARRWRRQRDLWYRFEDDPEKLHVRKAEMANHLRYLDERREQILVGGSLRRDPVQDPLAGLWIIEASDRQDAEKLCHGDPFWTQGLRKSVTILHYSKAFPDRKTAI